ncbi:YesL family protein [Saliterribacillus persicus]|uniref:Putative membrane protein YesL n=1 Tax=Saliterribacillus persicus TaxID=930114 RepID=A0A368XVT5_9BACI|nr:DUF624 domain-containing protein [Saliterribacillus persicus]RCW72005.1 putative membrane protein YesL [Saliterribacillus persicus]
MQDDSFVGKFYQFGEAILFLFYVNFLWVSFTLLGLVVFGLGPSTVAMFSIFRKWAMGEKGLPVFKMYWQAYREEFMKTNGITLLLIFIGYMLYINMQYFEVPIPWLNMTIKALFIIVFFMYLIMIAYFYPLYVHYDNKFYSYLKNALLITIYQPIRTFYLLAAVFTLYYLWVSFPIFLFLFGASLTSMIVMWISYRTFLRIEYKQSILAEQPS